MTTLNGKDLTAQDLARVRKLLSEDEAVLVECTRIRPQGNAPVRRRMVRHWPKISDADRAVCEAYLGAFASAKNASEGTVVDGPMADRNVYAGEWRMVRTDLSRLRTDPAQQGVYQTLIWPADSGGGAGGLCEESSPLHHEDATVYAESTHIPTAAHRNVKGKIYGAQGNIDPETGLWSGKETEDTARPSELYRTTSRTAERITVTTKGEHQNAPETEGANRPNVASANGTPTVEASADMDAYGLWSTQRRETWPVERITATADKSHKKYDEVEVSAANVTSVPSMEAVCKAANYTPDAQLGLFGILTGMSVRGNEFGLLDVSASWRIPKAVSDVVSTVSRSAEATTIVLHGEHLREEELAGKHLNDATSSTLLEVAAANGGNTFRGGKVARSAQTTMMENYAYGELRKEMDEFGLWSADLRVTVPVSVGHAIANVHGKHVDVEAVVTNADKFPTLDDAQRFGATLPRNVITSHAIALDVSFRGNDSGLLDVTARWRVPKEVNVEYVSSERNDITTMTTHKEHQTGYSTPSAAANAILEFRAEMDEFGLFTTDSRVTTAKPRTYDYESSTRNDATTHIYHGEHVMTVPSHTGESQYAIVDMRQDLDEFGLWTYDCRVTDPKMDQDTEHTDTSHKLYDEKETVFLNHEPASLAALCETGEHGIVVSLNFRRNEFGLLDGSVTVRTPKVVSEPWKLVGDDEQDGRRWQCWGWNQAAPVLESYGKSSDEAIIVSETRNSLNEFGLWDYVGTATEDKNPYGGSGGITYKGGKTRTRWVFIENHKNATLNSSTGYWQGTYESTEIQVRAFRTAGAAAGAAQTGEASNSTSVDNHISKHGRWFVLTTTTTTHHP